MIGLGWGGGGLAFSFLTIILAAVALGAKGRLAGLLLMVCAVAGAILGGTIVAVFMALAFIGGFITVIKGRN